MKKIISITIMAAVSLSLSAQTPAPSTLLKGAGADRSAVRRYSLEQILDSARQNNIAMRNARHDIEAARHQRKEAFTNFFPSVSGTGLWFNANKGMAETTVNPSEVVPAEVGSSLAQSLPAEALAALSNPISLSMMKNGTIAGIQAVQPVFAGGQIVNGNKLAKVGEEVSRLQMQLSENEVEKTAVQYFWQLAALQDKLKTVEAVETMLTDIRKDVEVAVKAGVAMKNDMLQVQLRQNDVASNKLKLQNGIFIVKQLLGQYANLTPTNDGEGSVYLFDVVVPSLDQLDAAQLSSAGEQPRQPFESALDLLPEYQLLQKQVEATKLQKKMAVGENLPSVAVGAGYNYHNMLDKDHSFGMIFATVSLPVTDWWGGSHAIKRKKIEHQKAQEQLADHAQLLQIRMLNTWNSVEESRQQLLIAQRSIEQAAENLRLNRNYYAAGTSKMSDLLEAQMLYQQACDGRTDAYANYQNKLLEYKQSVGQHLH